MPAKQQEFKSGTTNAQIKEALRKAEAEALRKAEAEAAARLARSKIEADENELRAHLESTGFQEIERLYQEELGVETSLDENYDVVDVGPSAAVLPQDDPASPRFDEVQVEQFSDDTEEDFDLCESTGNFTQQALKGHAANLTKEREADAREADARKVGAATSLPEGADVAKGFIAAVAARGRGGTKTLGI
jgi:hypothetical protein